MTRALPAVCETMACAVDGAQVGGETPTRQIVDGTLRAATGEILQPRDLTIREIYRFEGVSDPDDMEVLYAIESAGGVRGTLADAFGVYADPATAVALRDVPIRR